MQRSIATYRARTAILLASLAVAAAPAFGQSSDSGSAAAGQSGQQQATGGAEGAGQRMAGQGGDNALCRSGFASDDADGDGEITRSEFEAGRKAAFTFLDADADGTLTRSEYVDCLNQAETEAGGAVTRDVDAMAEADSNSDGQIDRTEYMQATHEARQQAQGADSFDHPNVIVLRRYVFVPVSMDAQDVGQMRDDETARRAAQQFNRLDRDGSGDISGEEWSSAGTAEGDADLEGVLNREYDRMDADSSGDVSRTEFMGAAEAQWQHGKIDIERGTSGQASGTAEADGMESADRTATPEDDGARGSGGDGTPPVVYYRYFVPLDAGEG